ncbi:MAG: 16S rRNA (cytidine(1402)-2'-O)-methyltransferase [Alphaproteobacteria bacterium]|nr:16S rRNA (cytidine(1402)-2'-O)-methyltransferase [Alphaproteobacteria bacterium]
MPKPRNATSQKPGRRKRGARKTSEKHPERTAKASDWPSGSKRGGLVLVATPIGNLADMTARAVETLCEADGIVCEDSRVTRKLLNRYGIEGRLTPYHEHNAEKARPALMRRLEAGESLALVSDAGTPLVSDPGYKLVRAVIEAGLSLTFLPGPSAPIAGLVLSGLPPDRFFFGGFLPVKAEAKSREIEKLATLPATLVFFESPKRLAATLRAFAERFGARQAAVVREATKLHEEVRRGPLATLAEFYEASGAPKGEVVLVIGPPDADAAHVPDDACRELLRDALQGMSLRDATDAVTAQTGRKRREVYALALALGKETRA